MKEIRNAAGKRVCDLSDDMESIVILRDHVLTTIAIGPDGKLHTQNEPEEPKQKKV